MKSIQILDFFTASTSSNALYYPSYFPKARPPCYQVIPELSFWQVDGVIAKRYWVRGKNLQFFSHFQVSSHVSCAPAETQKHLVPLQPVSQPELCKDELLRKCTPDKLIFTSD